MTTPATLSQGQTITATDVIPFDQSATSGTVVKFTTAQFAAWIQTQLNSGIASAAINTAGNLILTLENSGTVNCGSVAAPGFTSATIVGGALILTKSNGSTVNLGQVVGPAGANGSQGAQGAQGAPGAPGSSVTISNLGTVASMAATDLVGISQGGTDHAIPLVDLLNGATIDEFGAANPAADTDVFPVGQGTSTMLAQTFGALWTWAQGKLPSYKLPVVEIVANTTLDGSQHNGKILVCSQPVTLSPSGTEGSGFSCIVINASAGTVTLASGIATTSGVGNLVAGQMAEIYCVSYSAGTSTFAWMSGASIAAAPGAPVAVVPGTVTYTSIALSWSAPVTGGAATSYIVQYRITNSGSAWTQQAASVPSATIFGLASATQYDIQVIAANVFGYSAPTATINETTTAAPVTPPGQVTGLTTSGAQATQITLSWTAPASGGAVGSYTVQYRVTGSGSAWNTFATGVTGTGETVTGLSLSTEYDFQAFAVNATGSGAPSSVATGTTTIAPPGAPTALTAGSITTSSVALSWTAPGSGGTVATYTVQYRVTGTGTWTPAAGITGTSTTVTGLSAGTGYDFQVQAVNAGGNSAWTATTNATTTQAAPGAPSGLTAGLTTTTTQALTWTAPSSGGAVTSYTVQYRAHPSGSWVAVTGITGTGTTITGLTLNTAYDFEVAGVNGGGTGSYSATVTATTTNYKLTQGFLPSAAQSVTHGTYSGNVAINVNANCPPSSDTNTAPATVQWAYGTSTSTPPTTGWTGGLSVYNPGAGQTGYPGCYYGAYVNAPAAVGTYYVWFQALDSAGNVQAQSVNPYAVTAT